MDRTITENRLCCYVPGLREYDDTLRLRVVLHDFGMVWQHATTEERQVLVEKEPQGGASPFDLLRLAPSGCAIWLTAGRERATGVSVSLSVGARIIEPRGPTGPFWRQRSLSTLGSVKRQQNSPRPLLANSA